MFQFTIRHALVATACVAMILGGLFWLHRSFGIHPDSEQFLVDGVPITPPWTENEWEPGRSGVWASREFFTLELASRPGELVEIDQELFYLSYADHFGHDAFQVHYCLSGARSPQETQASVHPMASGGGIVDGACTIDFSYDSSKKVLTLQIKQWIHGHRTAKQCELRYLWKDDRFHLIDPPRAEAISSDAQN